MNMSNNNDLRSLRESAAQQEFEAYGFGPDNNLEDYTGWKYSNMSNVWSCPLFFERRQDEPSDSDGDRPTVRGDFRVEFAPDSADIVSAYASINGNDIGYRGTTSSSPSL
jgi:hypothetical protein